MTRVTDRRTGRREDRTTGLITGPVSKTCCPVLLSTRTITMNTSRIILSRRIILWASLIGLFASTYLLITYVSGAPIVCGPVHGCDVVRASKWAYTFGLPRPLLGVAFYTAIIALLGFRAVYPQKYTLWAYRLMLAAAFIGFVESAFLTLVQWLDINAFCIWCLTSAATATVIFVASFFDRAYAFEPQEGLRELKVLFWSFVAAVVVGGMIIAMFMVPKSGGTQTQIVPSTTSTP